MDLNDTIIIIYIIQSITLHPPPVRRRRIISNVQFQVRIYQEVAFYGGNLSDGVGGSIFGDDIDVAVSVGATLVDLVNRVVAVPSIGSVTLVGSIGASISTGGIGACCNL